MPVIKLTDLAIGKLPAPDSGQAFYRDSALAGFGVRISAGGKRVFALMHGSKERKLTTIGAVGVISLAEARQRAKEILAENTLGLAAKTGPAFDDALDQFLTAYKTKNRPTTAAETERLLRAHLSFAKKVGEITTADVTKAIDKVAAISERQHTFVAARTFFNWLAKRRLISGSPLAGVEAPQKPVSRERALSDKELAKVLAQAKLTAFPFGVILQLLILTGQRVGQIVNLDGHWVDREKKLITWPATAMKSGKPHTIPYGPASGALLGNKAEGVLFAFNSFSSGKKTFDAACPLPHWTLHDLRRTVRTHWAALRIPPHISERLLAHATGGQTAVAAIYDRYLYIDEMREALIKWETHLQALAPT